jgi:hypothetical protein
VYIAYENPDIPRSVFRNSRIYEMALNFLGVCYCYIRNMVVGVEVVFFSTTPAGAKWANRRGKGCQVNFVSELSLNLLSLMGRSFYLI